MYTTRVKSKNDPIMLLYLVKNGMIYEFIRTQFMEKHPLHDKYPDLHSSAPVELAATRQHDAGEAVHQPAGKIEAWMSVLERTHSDRPPEVMDRIKDYYHRQYVITADKVPESYFELQQRIAREQGRGHVEIPDRVREEMISTVIHDQEKSLDAWVDYLSSADAAYPTWFKYYTFRNVVKCAPYDKEAGAFKRRSASTTGPFPDIDREALSYMADAMQRHYGIADAERAAPLGETTKELLDRDTGFAKLYAHAMEMVTPATAEELKVTDGEWVKYDQGSDSRVLADTLQGHGTGWCTAGEGAAQAQLKAGDFYVYYTEDRGGDCTVPRIAIRMEQGSIAEVRGIEGNQNLESALTEVARQKMHELPGAEQFEKRSSDMQALTAIEKKVANGENPDATDLRFLYEFYDDIEGFGYEADPRIEELLTGRDWLADMEAIFDTTDNDEIVDRLVQIGREDAVADNFDKFSKVDPQLSAHRLIGDSESGYGASALADNLDKFSELGSTIAEVLIQRGHEQAVAENLGTFSNIETELAYRLIKVGSGQTLLDKLDSFPGIDQEVLFDRLIEADRVAMVTHNLDKFSNLSPAAADRLIGRGRGWAVTRDLDSFTDIDRAALVDRLIETKQYGALLDELDSFPGIDRVALANRLVELKAYQSMAMNLDKFSNLSPAAADGFIGRGLGWAVAGSLDSFPNLSPEKRKAISDRYGH